MLGIVEIDADNRVTGRILFDLDDIDAAFEELDARYLAGEAAAHARTWSVVARECAAFNRREFPAADPVTIDHRLLATIDENDLHATARATWDLMPDFSIHIEQVHRLSDLGAVLTHHACGTTRESFEAEWRMIHLLTVEGDRIHRSEIFDETDLDAALARFEELQPQAPRLENAATRASERLRAYLATRDWDAYGAIAADDIVTDDRRPIVTPGFSEVEMPNLASLRTSVDIGIANVTCDRHRNPRGAPRP